jgi:hypothetical protein
MAPATGLNAFGGDTAAMKGVARAADKIREQRKPAADDNPFVKFQEAVSKNIVDVLDKWRDAQEILSEALLLGIYGSTVVQAAVGVTPDADVSPKPRMSPEHRARLEARIAEKSQNRQRRSQGMRHSRSALCRKLAGNG